MSWISRKTMRLGEVAVKPGTHVPQSVVDQIPASRLGSLVRLGMLQEVEPAHIESSGATPPESNTPEGEGEYCPHCGAGPFARLAQHVSKMHQEE